MPRNPNKPTTTTPLRMIVRGMTKRCPFCGSRGIFDSWLHMKSACPSCNHHFNQEEGFYIGAYAFNFAITEGLVLLSLIPYVVLSSMNPGVDRPVTPFVIAGVLATIVGPIIFFPFSRTLWVALDLIVRGGRNLKEDR